MEHRAWCESCEDEENLQNKHGARAEHLNPGRERAGLFWAIQSAVVSSPRPRNRPGLKSRPSSTSFETASLEQTKHDSQPKKGPALHMGRQVPDVGIIGPPVERGGQGSLGAS